MADNKPRNTWKNKQEEQHAIFTYYLDKGLTPYQSAGLVGNFMHESSLDPKVENSIGAFGLAQWLNTRREELEEFAKENNSNPEDLKTQLDFSWHELNDSHKYALKKLKETDNIVDATYAVRKYYEKPREFEAHDSNRAALAVNTYQSSYDPSFKAPEGLDMTDITVVDPYIDSIPYISKYPRQEAQAPTSDEEVEKVLSSIDTGYSTEFENKELQNFMNTATQFMKSENEKQKVRQQELVSNKAKAELQKQQTLKEFQRDLIVDIGLNPVEYPTE